MAKPATLQIKLISSADTGYFYVKKEQNKTWKIRINEIWP